MKQKEKQATADRRGFLKLVGVGVATGGAALSGGARQADAAEAADKKNGLYKETAHVKTYYELAKF